MKQNIGKADKIIRLVLGLAIAALGIFYKSWWGLIALVPILTAFTNSCPLYLIFKLNTKNGKQT